MKTLIQNLIGMTGYHIVSRTALADLHAKSESPPIKVVETDLWPWLRADYNFRTLVDIGANKGDFGAFIAQYLKTDRTYFIEPQKECHKQIKEHAKNLAHFEIIPFALSDETGVGQMIVASENPSSSLMRPSILHNKHFPHIRESGAAEVEVRMLDDVINEKEMPDDIFIKIDVQGYECKVINGGRKLFERARGVLVEMSFVPLYEAQPLFEEVHEMLHDCGLRFAGIKNQIASNEFQPLFAHCLYIRS